MVWLYDGLKSWLFLAAFLHMAGCQTLRSPEDPPEPPQITSSMPIPEMGEAAIMFGGKTLEDTKKVVVQRKEQKEMAAWAEQKLADGSESVDPAIYANAVNLFLTYSPAYSVALMQKMVTAEREFTRQAGWKLAAQRPSKEIAAFIEQHLTEVVWKGNEENVLLPEMAEAVQANQVKTVYTLIRQGLMSNGAEVFARTMIVLNSDRSSYDFMDYLAKGSIEDLRQLNQKTVNALTCYVILNHFLSHGVALDHPRFEMLFYYAVSRNQAMSQLAGAVLEKHMAYSRENLAYALARLPIWLQMAYVEGSRTNPNPNVGLFLGDLKKLTAHREVVEEIDSLRR